MLRYFSVENYESFREKAELNLRLTERDAA